MDFKNVIIMSDLDGTLLDDKKEISPRDMESITNSVTRAECSR